MSILGSRFCWNAENKKGRTFGSDEFTGTPVKSCLSGKQSSLNSYPLIIEYMCHPTSTQADGAIIPARF